MRSTFAHHKDCFVVGKYPIVASLPSDQKSKSRQFNGSQRPIDFPRKSGLASARAAISCLFASQGVSGRALWVLADSGFTKKMLEMLKSPSNGTMQLPEYAGMSPASGGTAPGTLASERRLKMPSIARRPLLIST